MNTTGPAEVFAGARWRGIWYASEGAMSPVEPHSPVGCAALRYARNGTQRPSGSSRSFGVKFPLYSSELHPST
jgi:hypothetical protein